MNDQDTRIVQEAEKLAKQGQFEAAVSCLEKGSPELRTNQSALYIFAVCHRSTGKRKKERRNALTRRGAKKIQASLASTGTALTGQSKKA